MYTATVNLYIDMDSRYPPVSIEDVIERNPDIIILVNMGDISKGRDKELEKIRFRFCRSDRKDLYDRCK